MGTDVVGTGWGCVQCSPGQAGIGFSFRHRADFYNTQNALTKFTTIFATFRTKRKQIRLYVVDNYYDSFLPPGI